MEKFNNEVMGNGTEKAFSPEQDKTDVINHVNNLIAEIMQQENISYPDLQEDLMARLKKAITQITFKDLTDSKYDKF